MLEKGEFRWRKIILDVGRPTLDDRMACKVREMSDNKREEAAPGTNRE